MNSKSTRRASSEEQAFVTNLGQLVAMKRDVLSLDMRGVANAAGVSTSTISRLENGKWPDVLSLLRILRWLGPKLAARVFEPAP